MKNVVLRLLVNPIPVLAVLAACQCLLGLMWWLGHVPGWIALVPVAITLIVVLSAGFFWWALTRM